MKLPATLFVIIINISLLKSQVVSPSFRHFTTEDGLPSSEVYSVIQDKKGNLWFGTDRGAARYDGYSFRTFTYKDGLMDNTVFKFSEDSKGRLWMLTFSCQLFYYENDSVYAYHNNDKLTAIAENRVPFGFYVDSLENIFVSETE